MGQSAGGNRSGEGDEPRGFLEEAFAHRQRGAEPAPDGSGDSDRSDSPGEALTEPVPVEELTVDLRSAGLEPTVAVGEVASEPEAAEVAEAVDDSADVAPAAAADEVAMAPAAPTRPLDVDEAALVDEAMKKSGLIWLSATPGRPAQAMWFVWHDGAAHVLTGGGEQPDPGLAAARWASVAARSKDTRSRLVSWVGAVSWVSPADESWPEVAAALAKARLNLSEPATAPDRWAADETVAVYRLTPVGPLAEQPGDYSALSGRAEPVPSPATTAGPPPWVLHKRQTARRPLS